MTDKNTVNLARVYYPVTVLGPGRRVGIWLAGCDRNCDECISPELKSRNSGKEVKISEIMGYIRKLCSDAEGFTISGGEPFYNPGELRSLVEAISEINDDIIIFTGYTLEELRAYCDTDIDGTDIKAVLDRISVLVDGPFVSGLNDGRGLRGSSNQNIYVFKNKEKYKDIEICERGMQVVLNGDRVMTIGIPSVADND